MTASLLKRSLLALAATASITCAAQETTYNLPFDFEPNSSTINECVVIDANGDGKGVSGQWTINEGAFRYTYSSDGKTAADDWVILPYVNFGTNKTVTVSINMKAGGGYVEKFELMLGQERTIEAMTLPVLKEEEYKDATYKTFSAEVELPESESNIWALGIHAYSDADKNTIDIKDIKIEGDAMGGDEPPVREDYALPFNFQATQETFSECINIDANGDKDPNDTQDYNLGVWSYASTYGAFKYAYNATNDADDWLILPLVDFGTSAEVSVSLDARTESDPESFEVFLGRDRTIEAMTVEVMTKNDYTHNGSFETLSAEVKLPAAEAREEGNMWCLGIHATSPAFHFNLYINNIKIESIKETTGIENAVIDLNAPAEYFNLQGIRVDSPRKGQMMIVRQGDKTFKTIIR